MWKIRFLLTWLHVVVKFIYSILMSLFIWKLRDKSHWPFTNLQIHIHSSVIETDNLLYSIDFGPNKMKSNFEFHCRITHQYQFEQTHQQIKSLSIENILETFWPINIVNLIEIIKYSTKCTTNHRCWLDAGISNRNWFWPL